MEGKRNTSMSLNLENYFKYNNISQFNDSHYTETSNLNVGNNIKSNTSNSEAEMTRMIQLYGRPPIISLGSIGNVITFIVMQRGSLRKVSTCFYMAMLALADTGKSLLD